MNRIRWLILLTFMAASPAMADTGTFEWTQSRTDSNLAWVVFGTIGYATNVTDATTIGNLVSSSTCTEPLSIPINTDTISIMLRLGTDKIKAATTISGNISSASFDAILFPDAKEANDYVDNFKTYHTAAFPRVYLPYSAGNSNETVWYAGNINMASFGTYLFPSGGNRTLVLQATFNIAGATVANVTGYTAKVRFGRSLR